jgi:hypothetical protein
MSRRQGDEIRDRIRDRRRRGDHFRRWSCDREGCRRTATTAVDRDAHAVAQSAKAQITPLRLCRSLSMDAYSTIPVLVGQQ